MIITRENLIELLNLDLELEETAAIQYINHAATLTGDACGSIIKVLKAYAYERFAHAMTLADQIDYLGGSPGITVSNVRTSDDNQEMLSYDLDDEEDAIRRYAIRFTQAEQLNEMELAKRLRAIGGTGQQHAMYLKEQLRIRTREKESSKIRITGPRDFLHEWAEKGAIVPLRFKRTEKLTV